MKQVAIYTRVSTTDKGQDTDTQLFPLTNYVKARDWEIYKVYSDQTSGAKENRPALDELLKDAFKRKFDVVIVFRFDRFSRSTKQLITALDNFNSLGIDFVSYSESIDTTSSTGKLMFSIIASFAQFERSIIQQRVKAGLEKAKAKGKILGRPKLDLDIEKLRALRSQGLTLKQIKEKTGIPEATICVCLKK